MPISSRLLGCLLIVIAATFIPLNSVYFEGNSQANYDVSAVSFDLTPDYATAAVSLPDGSSVAVAKIEGSLAYKAFMRRQDDESLPSSLMDRVGIPVSILGVNLPLSATLINTRRTDRAAVQQLLQILKSAVESYLGHSICLINFSLPEGSLTSEYKQVTVRNAVYQIRLRQVVDLTYDAGKSAMIRNRAVYLEGPDKLILTVDNSRYGFNLGVYHNDDGVIDGIRQQYRHFDGVVNAAERAVYLKQALENIIRSPFEDSPGLGELPQTIQELVLYGDDIWSPHLPDVLKSIFDPDLISNAHKDDPSYAASLGLAEITFEQLNSPMSRSRGKAQFGCCWKSKDKGCPAAWM